MNIVDIAAYSPEGELQLVVEVKASKGVSEDWGGKLRRNMAVHGLVPDTKFFLLALHSYFYLWLDAQSLEITAADYKVPTKDVLQPYLLEVNSEGLTGQSLELLIMAWLRDLMNSDLTRESAGSKLSWLFDSGLYECIHHGSLSSQVAA